MPIRPYNASHTFSNARGNDTFRARNNLLGDLISSEIDYAQLLQQLPQTILQLYQAGRQADVQDALVQLNMQRAAAGLTPITYQMVGGAAGVTPQVQTTVGLSPELQQTLMIGAIGLGAVYFLSKAKRGKRR